MTTPLRDFYLWGVLRHHPIGENQQPAAWKTKMEPISKTGSWADASTQPGVPRRAIAQRDFIGTEFECFYRGSQSPTHAYDILGTTATHLRYGRCPLTVPIQVYHAHSAF